jgi:hypothetical protein
MVTFLLTYDFLKSLCNYLVGLTTDQHFFHNNPDAIEALGLFSLTITNDYISNVFSVLARELQNCIDCTDVFYGFKINLYRTI